MAHECLVKAAEYIYILVILKSIYFYVQFI